MSSDFLSLEVVNPNIWKPNAKSVLLLLFLSAFLLNPFPTHTFLISERTDRT